MTTCMWCNRPAPMHLVWPDDPTDKPVWLCEAHYIKRANNLKELGMVDA